jgi:cobalamin biosynthesis Mg chelatase CobN
MQQIFSKRTTVNKFLLRGVRLALPAAIVVTCVFSSPVFASNGTTYGKGTYGSGTYDGSGASAKSSSSGASGSQTNSNTSSGSTGAGGASQKSKTSTKNSSGSSPTTNSTSPTGSSQFAITTAASPKSNTHATLWLIAGIILVLLAIGIFIWLAVKRRHKHDDMPWNNQNPPQS